MAADSAVQTLLVDARPVDHPTARQRGIGRYVTGLLSGLHEIDAPLIALYGSDVEAEVLDDAIPGLRLERWSPQIVRRHATPGTWFVATQLMLHPIALDPIPSAITAARLPVAAVMYDVIPYRFPERYQVEPNARRQAQLRKTLAGTVDAMLAISRFAAETAAVELGYPIERIAMIGAGVDEQFVTPDVTAHPRPARVLPVEVGRYVVSVTGGDERKNTEGLLRGWAQVSSQVRRGRHLVIATAAADEVLRRWRGWADDFGIADEVVLTGSVTDEEMVAILQHAELAVMPSTEEGFGLPVVEAAACGCPAICSDVSSLPEVLEEPAAEFDPFDPASIGRAIERALTDDDHRALLADAGRRAAQRWRWSTVAHDAMRSLDTLGPRWPHRLRQPQERIAVVGPFGGSASGIGKYDEEVVAALDRHAASASDAAAVDVFVDTSESDVPVRIPRRPARAIGRYAKPWDYDHIIAALGSSPHHVATAQLAAEIPTHVWLHEASLVGVHVGLAHRSGSEGWARRYVTAALEATEPPAIRERLAPGDELDAPRLDELGVTMLSAVLDRARSVVVSSERAATRVRELRPDGAPLLVLPLAHDRAERIDAPAVGDIVAAGWLAANKEPELAVAALAALTDRAATLTFVGPAVEETAAAVRAAAHRLGVGARVHITDRLADDDYRRRLGRARVGLQLRSGDGGEMSAAIGDLLSLGVPVVTTMTTAGPASAGVRIVARDASEVARTLATLLADGDSWTEASADALARAAAWSFDDVAAALLDWLARVDELPPGAVERRGPATDRPR